MMDIIILAALGIFVYNRKIARDEKHAGETRPQAEEAAEVTENEQTTRE